MMKVADPKGVCLINRGKFPMFDPESGTRFEPGEVIKATLTDWVKAQAIFEQVAEVGAEPAPAPAPIERPARVTREPAKAAKE